MVYKTRSHLSVFLIKNSAEIHTVLCEKGKEQTAPIGTNTMGITVSAWCQRVPWKNNYQYKFHLVDWHQDLSHLNFKEGLGFIADF